MGSEKLKVTGEAGPGSQFGMRGPVDTLADITKKPKASTSKTRHFYFICNVPQQMNGDEGLNAYLSTNRSSLASQYNLSPTMPGGVNIVILNLAPGASTHMHRTISIDTTICVEGHGKIIQRGTAHRWINLYKDKPARTIGITVAARPILESVTLNLADFSTLTDVGFAADLLLDALTLCYMPQKGSVYNTDILI
ncbi:hypothetical protein BKA64DRAFT_643280 [Cadophora sp. MPI-SDFR-AT-0126]|nr:hypothetical protein BKA64DRAFT_643280 [Leotiomycetes sp. MPI-SDFR-AT-0126]